MTLLNQSNGVKKLEANTPWAIKWNASINRDRDTLKLFALNLNGSEMANVSNKKV